MRCRYLLYSFITKWNSTKLDSIFISVPLNNLTIGPINKISTFCNDFDENNKSSTNLLSTNSNKFFSKGSNTNLLGYGSEILTAITSSSSRTSSVNSLNNLNSLPYSDLNEFGNIGTLFNSNLNTTTTEINQNENNLSNVSSITKSLETPHSIIPIELPTLINPLPKNLHFELPIS